MAIMLVLVGIALAVAVGLVVLLFGSLLTGALLSHTKVPAILTAMFLFAVPASALGAAAGAVGIGYLAYQQNESLIFLGPLGGFIFGGAAGFLGGAGAGALWAQRVRARTA